MKKGFTLIELLVVVLIIGILSAVALPQYQNAVEKARAVEAITTLKSMRDAARLYVLETGENEDGSLYANHKNWSISFSGNWVDDYTLVTDYYIYMTADDSSGVVAYRCSGKCAGANQAFEYDLFWEWPWISEGEPSCIVDSDSRFAKKFCQSFRI